MELNPHALVVNTADTWNGKPLDDMSKEQLIEALRVMVRAYESQKNANVIKRATNDWKPAPNGPGMPFVGSLPIMCGGM